jgi:hypothetical protein
MAGFEVTTYGRFSGDHRGHWRQEEVAKIVHCGLRRCTRRRLTANAQPLGMNGKIGRFSQVLQETEHFWQWRQEKVAKIVQCGD